jgi:hypothetical protein
MIFIQYDRLRLDFSNSSIMHLLILYPNILLTKYTGCPRVAKKLHNLFVNKDINFFFFLDDSYASTAYSENIAVYIQSVPIL